MQLAEINALEAEGWWGVEVRPSLHSVLLKMQNSWDKIQNRPNLIEKALPSESLLPNLWMWEMQSPESLLPQLVCLRNYQSPDHQCLLLTGQTDIQRHCVSKQL